MALNWKSVSKAHIESAFKTVAARRKDKSSGIVVEYEGRQLPAKEVLTVAYRLANNLSDSEKINFSSGDATINFLTSHGFQASRGLKAAG